MVKKKLYDFTDIVLLTTDNAIIACFPKLGCTKVRKNRIKDSLTRNTFLFETTAATLDSASGSVLVWSPEHVRTARSITSKQPRGQASLNQIQSRSHDFEKGRKWEHGSRKLVEYPRDLAWSINALWNQCWQFYCTVVHEIRTKEIKHVMNK